MSIIFKAELSEKVLAGEKTVTRRLVNLDNPRAHWHPERAPVLFAPGRKHAVLPGRGKHGIGFIEIVGIKQETFAPKRISNPEARLEGFADLWDFARTWKELHGNLDAVLTWRVEFEVAS